MSESCGGSLGHEGDKGHASPSFLHHHSQRLVSPTMASTDATDASPLSGWGEGYRSSNEGVGCGALSSSPLPTVKYVLLPRVPPPPSLSLPLSVSSGQQPCSRTSSGRPIRLFPDRSRGITEESADGISTTPTTTANTPATASIATAMSISSTGEATSHYGSPSFSLQSSHVTALDRPSVQRTQKQLCRPEEKPSTLTSLAVPHRGGVRSPLLKRVEAQQHSFGMVPDGSRTQAFNSLTAPTTRASTTSHEHLCDHRTALLQPSASSPRPVPAVPSRQLSPSHPSHSQVANAPPIALPSVPEATITGERARRTNERSSNVPPPAPTSPSLPPNSHPQRLTPRLQLLRTSSEQRQRQEQQGSPPPLSRHGNRAQTRTGCGKSSPRPTNQLAHPFKVDASSGTRTAVPTRTTTSTASTESFLTLFAAPGDRGSTGTPPPPPAPAPLPPSPLPGTCPTEGSQARTRDTLRMQRHYPPAAVSPPCSFGQPTSGKPFAMPSSPGSPLTCPMNVTETTTTLPTTPTTSSNSRNNDNTTGSAQVDGPLRLSVDVAAHELSLLALPLQGQTAQQDEEIKSVAEAERPASCGVATAAAATVGAATAEVDATSCCENFPQEEVSLHAPGRRGNAGTARRGISLSLVEGTSIPLITLFDVDDDDDDDDDEESEEESDDAKDGAITAMARAERPSPRRRRGMAPSGNGEPAASLLSPTSCCSPSHCTGAHQRTRRRRADRATRKAKGGRRPLRRLNGRALSPNTGEGEEELDSEESWLVSYRRKYYAHQAQLSFASQTADGDGKGNHAETTTVAALATFGRGSGGTPSAGASEGSVACFSPLLPQPDSAKAFVQCLPVFLTATAAGAARASFSLLSQQPVGRGGAILRSRRAESQYSAASSAHTSFASRVHSPISPRRGFPVITHTAPYTELAVPARYSISEGSSLPCAAAEGACPRATTSSPTTLPKHAWQSGSHAVLLGSSWSLSLRLPPQHEGEHPWWRMGKSSQMPSKVVPALPEAATTTTDLSLQNMEATRPAAEDAEARKSDSSGKGGGKRAPSGHSGGSLQRDTGILYLEHVARLRSGYSFSDSQLGRTTTTTTAGEDSWLASCS